MTETTINIKDNELTIDDKKYEVDKLEPKQRYLVAQLKDIEGKIAVSKMQVDQHQMARVTCANLLIESTKEKK